MKLQNQHCKVLLNHVKLFSKYTLLLTASALYAQTQIGQAINGDTAGDEFGFSVSLSANGAIMAAGARYNDDAGMNAGKVKIYENLNGTWTQIGQDILGESAMDESGRTISLSANGNIIAIGAHLNDGNGLNSGHVRVFENQNGTWTQLGQTINGEAPLNFFGYSISLSADGQTLAVGAPFSNANGQSSGQMRVFENQNGSWVQVGQDINGEAPWDSFGFGIDLSADGNILATLVQNTSQVKIFEFINGNWAELEQDFFNYFNNSGFLFPILSSDGNIIALDNSTNDTNGSNSGQVRVFENQNGTWTQLGQTINGDNAGDLLGARSLSADGTIMALGINGYDGTFSNSGAIRILHYQNGNWVQIGTDIEGLSEDEFSGGARLSADGNTLAFATPNNDTNGSKSGQVRVFDLSNLLSVNYIPTTTIRLFPNPSSDFLKISNLNSEESYHIYNSIGAEIQAGIISIDGQIDIRDLAQGLYFLKIRNKANQRFIKD